MNTNINFDICTENITSLINLSKLCDKISNKYGSLENLQFKINFDYTEYISFSDLNYKRNLMCSSDCVDIYLICWKKGQKSKIHDHPEKGCYMVVLDGTLKENKYYNDYSIESDSSFKEKLSFMTSSVISTNENVYNNGSNILHQIVALQNTISLHIYHKGYVPKFYN